MTIPAPMVLARQLAALLHKLEWGIGGSVLLWKLGLESAPRDLDIMTSSGHFEEASARIADLLGPGAAVPHPAYRSRFFARYVGRTASVDLFADVRVQRANGPASWAFDPSSIELYDGLPWMRALDWLELYELFDRPDRVDALRAYILAEGNSDAR